jgi:excisionase family DNA binding protein
MLSSEHDKLCASSNMLAQTHLLKVSEVAVLLRQSERTIRDKIAAGDLAAVRIGSGPRAPIRVDAAELEAFIHERNPQ